MRPVQNRLLCQTVAVTLALGFVACTDTNDPLRPGVQALFTTPTGLLTANPPQIFVGAGDISSCSNSGDEATAKLLDAIPNPATVYNIGDDVYDNGTTSEFNNCYNPTWGRHKYRTKPTPGNHEYNSSGAAPYYAYFGAAAGPSGRGYYSYDLGSWHILSLNSNVSSSAGSAQDTWLRADLAAHPQQCILAYYHHPLYSSTATYSSVRGLVNALYAYHADLILNGHRHFYERLAPMDPTGKADPVNGVREIIAGMGGIGGGSPNSGYSLSQASNGSTFGVLKLYLYDDSYAWKFVPVAGKTYTDSGSTACHSSGGGGGGGVSASNSTVSANPTSFTAGSGSSTITVTAKDGNGNTISGASVTVTSSGTGNTLSPASGSTNSSGVFTSSLTSTVAETKTVSATIDGTAITQTASITVNPSGGGGGGTIAQTLLTSGGSGSNSKTYNTASIAPAANALVTVAVLGKSGSGALTPTLSGGGISTWTQVASVAYDPIGTPASRLVVFRGMSASPGSGAIKFTYTSSMSNTTWMVSQWTGVDQTGTNGSGAIGQTGSVAGDATTSLSKALAVFANANNVGFGVIGVSANPPIVTPGAGSTEIGEIGSGESTALETQSGVNDNTIAGSFPSDNAGLLAIEIKAGASAPAVSAANSTVGAVSPISAGGSSTITVTVKDGSSNPISGVNVTLSATGTNTITQPASPTNANGVTTGSLGATVAGSNTVTAVAGGVTITQKPVVVVNPGPASALAFSVQPNTAAAGATISPTVQVQIRDAFGNLVSATDNVTLGIGTNPAAGTLSGTTTVAASGGTASFSDLSIDNAGTGYTLAASSGSLTGATSNAFNISATPAKLGFFVPPSTTAAGATITPAVQVEIQDNAGNRVTTATNTVALAIGTNPGGGTLSGTVSASAVAGVASFSNLSINAAGTGYTLSASSTGLTGIGSNPFDITPPASGSITHTLLTSGHDPTNTSTFTTASIAPAPNTLVTVAVLTHQASAAAPDPTLTGGGMASWQVVASVAYDGATPLDRLTIYRAMSAAPGSGPLTITSSVTVSNCQWIVSQWSGVDGSGTNGSGAIVQTKSATGAAVTTLTASLASFASGNDVAYGAFGVASATSIVTAGSGFATIDQQPSGESSVGDLFAEWALNTPAVTASWPSKNAGALGVEIKAAP